MVSSIQVETAFSAPEVLEFSRNLKGDLIAECREDDGEDDYWDLVRRGELRANSTWNPRLLNTSQLLRLEDLITTTALSLHRNPLVPREESVRIVSPGVKTRLTERVIGALRESADGGWVLTDLPLWEELNLELELDLAVRSGQPTFELRGCAMCAKWYEPQLSNRSRFCSPDCRKRFNNTRNSARQYEKVFKCEGCTSDLSIELFSGLANVTWDEGASSLRIHHLDWSEKLWCVDCVQKKHKEWSRYIAPLVDARYARDARDVKERAAVS